MFDGWGRLVYRRRRLVLVIALIVVAFAAAWGTGVFGKLQSSGGFTPPNSQSQRSSNLATAAFGRDAGDVVVLYSSPTASVRSPSFRAAVTHVLAGLPASRVESTATYWSTGSAQFVSASGRATYAVLELAGSPASTCVTAARKDGERTLAVGLEYRTTTSPASRPNAAVARLLDRWLWLFGGVNPPDDCSFPKTPVPQAAANATTISAITRTSRLRRYTRRPQPSNIGSSASPVSDHRWCERR
jgi:hypothetical protein